MLAAIVSVYSAACFTVFVVTYVLVNRFGKLLKVNNPETFRLFKEEFELKFYGSYRLRKLIFTDYPDESQDVSKVKARLRVLIVCCFALGIFPIVMSTVVYFYVTFF